MDRQLLKEIQDCLIELLLCKKEDPDAWNNAVRRAGDILQRIMELLNKDDAA